MTAQAGDTEFTRVAARRDARARRAAIPPRSRRAAAQRAAAAALGFIRRHRIRSIALYLSHGSELGTAPLLARLPRYIRLHLPMTLADGRMRMIPVGRGTRLVTGAHGIRVPAARSRAVRARDLDLVLLPLSAYDARGNRLGAGAGYYDRWLAPVRAHARPWRIGYAFSVQQCASLPHAPWDVPLHGIISERGLSRCRRTD